MESVNAGAIERVNSLIEITRSLSEIFAKENDLLTSSRPRELAPLQAEKARLAAAYAQSIRDVAANREIVEGADTSLLATLRDITKTFEERAARQRSLLDGARAATEGVIKAVAEEAAQKTPGYDRRAPNVAAPISLDERA